MMTILYGISSLEYHRTPPVARGHTLSDETLERLRKVAPDLSARRNAPPELLAISRELFGLLKGVSLPIHLAATTRRSSGASYVVWHERGSYGADELVPIGEDLFATTPLRTLLDLASAYPVETLARVISEACGIHAVSSKTSRLERALDEVDRDTPLASGPSRIAAYYGIDGEPLAYTSPRGAASPWEACFTSDGTRLNLWKRAPLCTLEETARYAEQMKGYPGADKLRRAAALAVAGSASPEETLAGILLGGYRVRGQEGFPPFHLNQRVALPRDVQRAVGGGLCVVDIGWFEESSGGIRLRGCCEVDGKAVHTSANAGRDHVRQSVLERMGVGVARVTHDQIVKIDAWDVLVDVMRQKLGCRSPLQTPQFLKRRAALREKLLAPSPLFPR